MQETSAVRETVQRRRNSLLWAGSALILVAILSDFLYFLRLPGQGLFPWLNLLLTLVPVVPLALGLRRAITQPAVYRGKIAGWVLTGLSVVLFAVTALGHLHARDIPGASAAPQVGQKAPDFVLPDTGNKAIRLSDLLSVPMENGAPPKAVLLVFYRGYW